MDVIEALELAEQSIDSFKASLERLSAKELFKLVSDLRRFNNPLALETAHLCLLKELDNLYEGVKDIEQNSSARGIEKLQKYVYDETGFETGDALPSVAVKRIIDEVKSWKPRPEISKMVPAKMDDFNDFFKKREDDSSMGDIIDVTPEKIRSGIDFDDDTPIVEQILEKHRLDRTDKKPEGCRQQAKNIILALSLLGTLICLLIYIVL